MSKPLTPQQMSSESRLRRRAALDVKPAEVTATQGTEGAAPQACTDERPCLPCYLDAGQCAAPQAVVGEASGLTALEEDVKNAIESDEWACRLFDGFSHLMVDAEARCDIQGKALVKSMRDSFAALRRALAKPISDPTPTAPQEADVLREALKGTVAAIEGMHGRKPEHVEAALANAKHALLAAPAQHQPQQGEQHGK